MDNAADLLEHAAQIVRDRRGRRDRVHRADFHAGSEHAERQRGVAVDHNLRLGTARRRDAVLEVEILLGPVIARVQQFYVRFNNAGIFLAEYAGNLIAPKLQVKTVNIAEHSQCEHVLAALRIGDDQTALALHRNFDDLVARFHELVVGLDIGSGDFRVLALAPHAFQQNGAVGLEFAGTDTAKQHLLVERNHQVGFVAAIGDTARAQTCLLYTSDAADDLTRVDLGGRRIIKKKKKRLR